MDNPRSSQVDIETKNPVPSLISWLILLGGLLTICVAAYMVIVTYSSLPYSDGWTQIFAADKGENPLSASWLWHPHNEHRLVIPKLFLVADLRLFRARQILLLNSIFAIQLVHFFLLAWSMRVLGKWRGALLRSGVGLVAFCLFCPSQWENLTWGFQTCFVLPGMFATISFIGLLLYKIQSEGHSGGRWKFLLLSIAAALGATYSLASGNLLWPLLVVATLVLRLRRSVVLSYVITGVISTALYLHKYVRPPQNSDPMASIRSPLRLLEYIAVYFGSSWVTKSIGVAICLGALGLMLALIVCWRLWRGKRPDQAFIIQIILTVLYCLGTGFLTSLGRLGSGDVQAFSSRYQTVALLFWGSLGLLLLAGAMANSRRLFFVAQLALLAVLVRGAVLARFPLRGAREHSFQLHAAATALLLQVDDREQLQEAFPHPDYILRAQPLMREQQLSTFAEDPGPKLDDRLDATFQQAAPDQCAGAVQSVAALSDGAAPALRITGWAWDRKNQRPPLRMLVVVDGKIVGFGPVGDWRPTIRAAHPFLKTSFIGFTGYAKNVKPGTPVSLFSVLAGEPHRACYVATVTAGVP